MCGNFAEYQIDLESFINEIVLPDCPPPIFALAQSMGATVLLRAAHAGTALVRSHGVAGADDRRFPACAGRAATRTLVRTMRLMGLGASMFRAATHR